MQVSEAYSNWSTTYDQDRNLTRDLDETVTRDVLAGLYCKTIVEIGCGTGKNTSFLAQIGGNVRAFDFSEGMLAKAREKVTAENVTFAEADITQPWPVEDGCAELVVCNLVLEHVEDLSPVFSEAFRVLGEGGRMFVCELHPFRQYQGTQANFQRGGEKTEISAFVHDISEFMETAKERGFALELFNEWRHPEDQNKSPRLVSFMFAKPA